MASVPQRLQQNKNTTLLVGIWRMQNRRQHQSPWLCLFAALLSFPVNKSGSPLTLVGAEHKLLACEGSVLPGDRMTAAAANKASVFTGFMGETRKERRQQEEGGGQDGGEMWLPASTAGGEKMNRGNRTIMEPTGIQLGFKNMELSFCASRERVQMQFRYRRTIYMTYGRWWRGKRRWADKRHKSPQSMRTVLFTME